MRRRKFVQAAGAGAAAFSWPGLFVQGHEGTPPRTFRLWAMGDSHVGTDLKAGRTSLADALRQSEQGGNEGGPPFEWDLAIHVGDLAGGQGPPTDAEGEEVVRQYGALKHHRREQVYDLAGNHDASGPDEETQWWFKKWVDPLGENTAVSGVDPARRPYPVDGTWERYSFKVGNLLFLIMSDRNDGGPPVGRSHTGGYPSGGVTGETFDWWKQMLAAHSDSVVISAHHHMLRETTVASGPWEGYRKNEQGEHVSHYHGYFPDGGPEGASYLYWVDREPNAGAFERHLAAHPGAIDLWLGGHTHTNPDDTHGGRSHLERRWDATFLNCAALTKYHNRKTSVPMSRLLTFTDGSDQVRVQCCLHTSQYAKQGWYAPAERTIRLNRPFLIRPRS